MLPGDSSEEPLPSLPPREADAHKGDFGTALIVGGSRGMTGAVILAGMAALRGGAGLVRLAVPRGCLAVVAGYEPSYMTAPLPEDDAGRIAFAARDEIVELSRAATVVGLGPGLGRSPELVRLVAELYAAIDRPMVVDADALNALAGDCPDFCGRTPQKRDCPPSAPGGPRILTPHPGEFARLIGKKLAEPARSEAAVALAGRSGAVVLLKGHRTLITDGRRQARNTTGNPGLARGGSGDVLTGLITALACQGLAPYEAARLAAHVHGLAGDLAAAELGQVGMIASDLLRFLPPALREGLGIRD